MDAPLGCKIARSCWGPGLNLAPSVPCSGVGRSERGRGRARRAPVMSAPEPCQIERSARGTWGARWSKSGRTGMALESSADRLEAAPGLQGGSHRWTTDAASGDQGADAATVLTPAKALAGKHAPRVHSRSSCRQAPSVRGIGDRTRSAATLRIQSGVQQRRTATTATAPARGRLSRASSRPV